MGKSQLSEGTFTAEPVGEAFSPLDQRWGLNESLYSRTLARHMIWLSGMLPSYEAAAEVFQRVAGRAIPVVSMWRQTQRHGKRLTAHSRQQQERVRPERVALPGAAHDHHQRKGVSMDGGMVNIRGEGWKEFKAGAVFDVEQRWERDRQTHELVQVPHGVHMAHAAVLGSPADFAPALWKLAVEHDIPQADDSSVTAEGADWIWNLTNDLFPESVQIVDWYHACQHLAQAAAALHPDLPDQAKRWYQQAQATLYQNGAWAIAAHLEAAKLPDYARYFHIHQRRMRYQEFHEEGYPIGPGTIESRIKQRNVLD